MIMIFMKRIISPMALLTLTQTVSAGWLIVPWWMMWQQTSWQSR